MILYDQDGERDCLKACIQTVLQRPNVPSFWRDSAEEQDQAIRDFLKTLSCVVYIFYGNVNDIIHDYHGELVIAWGPSPRHKTFKHAVVAQAWNGDLHTYHDPHPSRLGVESFSGLMIISQRLR